MVEVIKKMAELLRSGATMLQETCPVCNSPMFRFEGNTFCVKCGVSKEPSSITTPGNRSDVGSIEATIPVLSGTILKKLKAVEVEIRKTEDPSKLYQLTKLVLALLEAIKVLRNLENPH
ncbi:MAG: Sjogren's syndrome/scleroderma autoantigen 1 family protein [Candidatus Atabeyarchaeum deiterrae]